MQYTIADEIFVQYPGYVRGVVVAHGIHNGATPEALLALLRQAESTAAGRMDAATLTEHPRLAAWREAYRQFGAKPSKFPPSIESLLRRVVRGQPLPSINAAVDIGNLLSLRYCVPVGSHAIDELTHDLCLRPATGAETFVAFGSEEVEHPAPGEVVFVSGDVVLTRRWTWRQAQHTLTLPTTTALELNVDGLPPTPPDEVAAICQEAVALLQEYCGGAFRWDILTREHPRMSLAALE